MTQLYGKGLMSNTRKRELQRWITWSKHALQLNVSW